jgi:hypothetical protein
LWADQARPARATGRPKREQLLGQAIVFCGLPPSTLVALHLNLDHPAGKGRNRMVLTNDQIIEARESGGILIEPFVDKQLQGASYDLRVGFEGATTSSKKVINIKEAGFLVIQPGDFATVVVLEELHFSAMYTARFELRSKLARKGLIPAIGPQIDPGYRQNPSRFLTEKILLPPNSIAFLRRARVPIAGHTSMAFRSGRTTLRPSRRPKGLHFPKSSRRCGP